MRRLVLLALLVLVAAGCGGGQDSAPMPPAAPTGETVPTAAVPTTADPLAGVTLDGEPLGLEPFRGEYLFVNVWSSW